MAFCKQITNLKCCGSAFKTVDVYRHLHISSVFQGSVASWRIKQKLPAKGREYGPLTDLPDWSYADGRPAPLSEANKRKIKQNREYLDQIIKLTKEVDKCHKLNQQKAANEEEIRKKAIENRLKSKGKALS
ncbi:39S ribosomal protein L52 [Trichonephila clavata]|uniref:Large ribosomal subunit protein mL52 n=1 Tax=Trichonephila clavata TaxID=2740835 RepID=A0A8X6H2S0_TRICU|nr:39S ribosomal protein L52 [Trichonephila clavata]